MKLIIAGGRQFNDYDLLCTHVSKLIVDTSKNEIVSGMADGADSLGVRYAEENNVSLIKMPADWNKHGKSAGYKRNEEMAKIADACICFWDGESRGTKHMIDLAKKYNLITKVITY